MTTGESVYNLEVHGHHIYQVTELGVLVHNSYNSAVLNRALNRAKEFAKGKLNRAAHIVPNPGWVTATKKRPPNVIKAIKDAKAVLKRAKIELDTAQNGFRAGAGHLGTHRNKFRLHMRDRLKRAEKAGNVAKELAKLKLEIKAGKFTGPEWLS